MESESRSEPKGRRSADQPALALEAHLGYWLRLVSNEVSLAFERGLQKRNISVAEWVALNQLATGKLTPAKLAAAMAMTPGAISKILDKLESKKLVSRSVSPLDSRVQLLSLTEQSKRILPRLTSIADDNDRHFFAALDPGERSSLRTLLRKLAGVHQMTRIPVE